MALITRITRLFKADFHAVLDQVEEPLMLLKQAVREMEDEVNAAELHQRQALIERDKLKGRRDELEQALGDLGEEMDVCFEEEQVDLARDLIKRKLQAQRLSKRVEVRLDATQKEILEGQKVLTENRAALESMRQKAELFNERLPSKGDNHSLIDDMAWSPQELAVSDNDVEVAFLREKKRRAQS
jgi:phage shock protein A